MLPELTSLESLAQSALPSNNQPSLLSLPAPYAPYAKILTEDWSIELG